MALKATPLNRSFYYDGRLLADPDPALSIEDVRAHYTGVYPDLNNASYTEEITDTAVKITFTAAVGTKG
jgi:PRTRC genetic system protein C